MLKRGNHFTVDTAPLFLEMLIERSLGSEERSDLIRMKILYTEMLNKVHFDHRSGVWAENELMSLWSEISMLKTSVGKTFLRRIAHMGCSC